MFFLKNVAFPLCCGTNDVGSSVLKLLELIKVMRYQYFLWSFSITKLCHMITDNNSQAIKKNVNSRIFPPKSMVAYSFYTNRVMKWLFDFCNEF